MAGSDKAANRHFFLLFFKRRRKITVKIINLKSASKLALEIFQIIRTCGAYTTALPPFAFTTDSRGRKLWQ